MITAHDVKGWLRDRRDRNEVYLGLMAMHYDLDGALSDGQYGLAWWTQRQIMMRAANLFLAEAGVPLATGPDRVESGLRVLRALGRVNPSAAERMWHLYLRPQPEDRRVREEIDRTLFFIEQEFAMPWLRTRESTVRRWADDTKRMREAARRMGLVRSDDWYLNTSDDPDMDWYDEVLDALDRDSAV